MSGKCWRCHLGSGSCQPPSFLFAQAATSALSVFKLFLLKLKYQFNFSKYATFPYRNACMHTCMLFFYSQISFRKSTSKSMLQLQRQRMLPKLFKFSILQSILWANWCNWCILWNILELGEFFLLPRMEISSRRGNKTTKWHC